MKIKRALISCSDKTGLIPLAKTLIETGTEIFASGGTHQLLTEAGLKVQEASQLSRNPEAFSGRMKTLSFQIFGGILFRRNNLADEAEMKALEILPIDAVIVNFYPFEKSTSNTSKSEKTELIDIGGPALVRAAAKNSPDVLCLTDPAQYQSVIVELNSTGIISEKIALTCSSRAWDKIAEYDRSIADVFGETPTDLPKELRYGENPHQRAWLKVDAESPLDWNQPLTPNELSYNNILDVASAYPLARDLKTAFPEYAHTVIVKHGNPCGVASVLKSSSPDALIQALERAWKSDPTSAFGGVLVFTEELNPEVAKFLSERFIEVVAAPELTATSEALKTIMQKRKGLKAIRVTHWKEDVTRETAQVSIPGGTLLQTRDSGLTVKEIEHQNPLVAFGILVTRALKSNAIGIFNRPDLNTLWLVGAGQGQPNRIDSLKTLAIPRAQNVLEKISLSDCVLVSDAFFPFRDSVDEAAKVQIPLIVQPGGSLRDQEVLEAAKSHGIELVLTGTRHFRH